MNPDTPVTAGSPPAGQATDADRLLARAAAREIQSSSDLRAAYDKYRSHPDATGEIAFQLSRQIDDCAHFYGKPLEQLSREMNSVGSAALSSPARRARIQRQIDRCRGFLGWPEPLLNEAVTLLCDRALAAGHAGATAMTLMFRRLRGEDERSVDAEAMKLLSGNPDAAVLQGVHRYLAFRNGWDYMDQFGDPAVTFAAWMLLGCNHGGTCDDSHRMVMFTCIYHDACALHDVAASLPFWYPGLDPEKMEAALRAVPQLAARIRERDWESLGFAQRP